MTPAPIDKVRQERAVRTILDEAAFRPEPDGSCFLTPTYDDLLRLCETAYTVGWEHAIAEAEEEIRRLEAKRHNHRPLGR